jgi:hypothetical protein
MVNLFILHGYGPLLLAHALAWKTDAYSARVTNSQLNKGEGE